MLLRHSLDRDDAAREIERGVEATLAKGLRTADIASPMTTPCMTEDVTAAVVEELRAAHPVG